ncbi:MAG: DNA-directed RNA polymerase subunit P [Euryarchaeota archaeon]|nr:DNA-directed RNA polymerase subunit P [Euryarchaeota archaeon]
MDLETLGLTCRKCGNKIFYKKRPSTKKTVTSD